MRRHPRHGGSSAVFSYESSKDSNSLTATCRESHLKGQENQRWPTHHEQQLVVATRGLCGSKWDKGSVVQQAFDLLEGAFCLPKLARPLDEQLQRRGDCEARGCLVEPVLCVSPPFDKHLPPDRQGLMQGAKILPGLCVLGGILRDDVNIPRERVGPGKGGTNLTPRVSQDLCDDVHRPTDTVAPTICNSTGLEQATHRDWHTSTRESGTQTNRTPGATTSESGRRGTAAMSTTMGRPLSHRRLSTTWGCTVSKGKG